ncbi:MAG: substrate-binding domain-containing protein [Pseudomonadota bacterium]
MITRDIEIGLVLFDPRYSFFWAMVVNCIQTEAARSGAHVSLCPVSALPEQVERLHAFIDRKVDVIVLQPMSAADPAMLGAVHMAIGRGIPVITLNSETLDGSPTCAVGTDDMFGQRLVAQHILERLGGVGKVAYLHGDRRIQAGRDRSRSFTSLLLQYPSINLCFERELDWLSPILRGSEGITYARQALDSHPDLNAFICANDEAALGAIDVIAERGLTGKILVSGFDCIPEALLAIVEGRMAATIRQSVQAIAYETMKAVVMSINLQELPRVISTRVDLITDANAKAAFIDTLQLIPGMIETLVDSSEIQRRLQDDVIAAQHDMLKTMAAVSNALSSIRDLDQMLSQVAKLILERFDLSYVAVYLPESANAASMLAIRVADGQLRGGISPSHGLDEGGNLPLIVAQCVRCQKVQIDLSPPHLAAEPSAEQHCSSAALPLMVDTRIVGILYLQSVSRAPFDADAIMVLQTIADQVAVAISNANLFAEQVTTSRFLDLVLDNIPSVLYVKDALHLRYLRWNKAGEELYGDTREHRIGKTAYDFSPASEADALAVLDRQAFKAKKMMEVAERVMTPGFGERLLHTRKIPVFGADGKPAFIVGISDDITERKKAQEMLANRADELETAYKALQDNQEKLLIAEKMASIGRLTAGIAHEMNTPLAAVRSGLTELRQLVAEYRAAIGDLTVIDKDHSEIADEMTQAIDLANRSAERAAGFVRGVKSQTRDLSAQQLIMFNPIPVIEEAIMLLGHALRNQDCKARLSAAPNVSVMLHGSPGRLMQVVTNLITNAIDASSGRHGMIDLQLALQGKFLELRVSDNGSGIDPSVIGKIFEPMFTTKPFGQGTGLGLSIVHDIVTGDFGGSIEVHCPPGGGTTFVLLLGLEANKVG